MKKAWLIGIVAVGLLVGEHVSGGDSIEPGKLVIETPTLHCLGFEWPIEGDDDRDAEVAVAYREKGEAEWRKALPLLRIGGEKVAGVAGWPLYVTPHMFAGSIFDLEPGADYEVRFRMSDPDGGGVEELVTTRTKPRPTTFDGGRRLHVYAQKHAGERRAPSFESIKDAFDAARPGDQILVHAGTYVGSYVVDKDGTPEKPIVVRGAGDGEAILINDGARQLLDIHKADYLWFEDLTFRTPGNGDGGHTVDGVVLWTGNRAHGATPGCKGLVVRHCKFEDFGVGVMAADKACRSFTITDNYFYGRQDWRAPKTAKDKDYTKYSYVAIWLAGSGHDAGYNFVRGFRDGINVTKGGAKDDPDPACLGTAIDIYNNDITQMGDDFLETDYGAHNIRVYRNRCTNTQTCGLSAQPVYGGPAYFIRNTVYNSPRAVPLKFNVRPSGLYVYHNTFVTKWRNLGGWSNGHFRNNLFVGTLATGILTEYSTMDHDGFMAGPVMFRTPAFGWANREKGEPKVRRFPSFKKFVEATGLEKHAVMIDYDIFESVVPPVGLGKTYDPAEPDMRLKQGAVAIDAGAVLPNISDGFAGKAPDLGAFELGQPLPHYGPRARERR